MTLIRIKGETTHQPKLSLHVHPCGMTVSLDVGEPFLA